ncbi:MAG TPA: hypothetical protein VJN48_16360 [Terriglobales bacterium]|nr:hypothetical protein [Terriglobales bacterium]
MKRSALVMFLCCSSLLFAQSPNRNPNKAEPPIFGPHWTRETAAKIKPSGTSNNLIYHGGPILPSATIKAIFWGSSWGSYTGDKITGMDKWYTYVGTVSGGAGSAYEATVNEYTGSGQQVTSAIIYRGHAVDSSSVPKHLSTSAVLAEACKVVGSSATANGYYPVYVDRKRGGANYCAYHSWGSCGGTPVEFGFFFNLDGDAGCDPQSTVSGESQGLAALANVSGHELSETRSDPNGNAWYSSNGSENGDLCAWTFGGPSVTFLDGTNWKIQGNWSNEANDGTSPNGPGYGPTGCVDGTNKAGPYTK